MRTDSKTIYNFLSDDQLSILESHLQSRFIDDCCTEKFNVVFDLLHQCDINCIGCGTNAICIKDVQKIEEPELTFEAIEKILLKIKHYAEMTNKAVFVNFGGGEPFLRNDIIRILKKACELFGVDGVGIDTNASLLDSYELIVKAEPYVSYIGVSINGLHDYHNWWANNHLFDAYERTTGVIQKLCKIPDVASKIEVTTVATTKNIDAIPTLMEELSAMGVKNYSVHRAIPVGRMERLKTNLIPSWKQYLILLLNMIEKAKGIGMNAHLHHSIEGIHGTLLCGIDTMVEQKLIDKNHRSSIGIEPDGELTIDPWCTVGYWKKLSLGNILCNSKTIDELFVENQEKIAAIQRCYSADYRCGGCNERCSGGNRIVAAASFLKEMKKDYGIEIIYQAFSEKDPACPLYEVVI